VADAEESRSVVELLDVRLSERPALAQLERLRSQAEALGHARLRLRAAEAVVRAALAAGDFDRARKAAAAGLERADACGGYFGSWRLHLLLARAQERAGKRAEAEAERERARAEIARVSRELTPGQRESFYRLPEVQELADPIEVGRPAARKD
jgi:eukaryotic-like serine/threonine-protein kinase